MNNSTRIGLVEVGSNSIRYLVADFANDMSFVPKRIETVDHDLHPSSPTSQAIDRINEKVGGFIKDAEEQNCDSFLAYGTAACRAAQARFPGKLASALRVLTPAEEAMAGWVAGFLCVPAPTRKGVTCTVVDEGSGSTEIIRATWSGAEIIDIAFSGAKIGSIFLAEAYETDPAGHVKLSADLVTKMAAELIRTGVCGGDPGFVYLVGGVATKVGWLLSGKSGKQEYRPYEVNGVRITRDGLNKLYARLAMLYRKDPDMARQAVDARRGSEREILRTLGSIPYLTLLANQLDRRGEYSVSGFGVRHGMAFLIRQSLIGM